jgi:hypothetical protein
MLGNISGTHDRAPELRQPSRRVTACTITVIAVPTQGVLAAAIVIVLTLFARLEPALPR